jgi:hypothetical protein
MSNAEPFRARLDASINQAPRTATGIPLIGYTEAASHAPNTDALIDLFAQMLVQIAQNQAAQRVPLRGAA